MKKLVQISLFVIAINCVFAQEQQKDNKVATTKSIKWQWDTIITYDTVGFKQRITQTFDSKENVLITKTEVWQNKDWVNFERIKYLYNKQGNLLTDFYERCQNNTWIDSLRHNYTYNSKGKMITCIEEQRYKNLWLNHIRHTCK